MNDVQSRESFASTGNAGHEADYFLRLLLRSLDNLYEAVGCYSEIYCASVRVGNLTNIVAGKQSLGGLNVSGGCDALRASFTRSPTRFWEIWPIGWMPGYQVCPSNGCSSIEHKNLSPRRFTWERGDAGNVPR